MAKLGKLDENSLQLVIKEFNRCKKGTDFKNYRITDYIDSGRYARVYAVEGFFGGKLGGKGNGRKYALRIADDDRSERDEQKNLRERNVVKQLMRDGEKHVVQHLMAFTVETEFGVKYCTLMPFLSTLSKYRSTADDVEIAVRCGCDLLPLLQACMQRQILHRDIKPQNIFFDGDFRNESGLILGDFGEARWDSDGTVTGIGTPATVSPEIACFDDDIKNDHHLCDMYSLGIVMYYYLNGREYPFGNTSEAHRKRLSTKSALPAPRYGSERLKQLVVKATQYYPSMRFSSPMEMLEELKKCSEYARYIRSADDSSEETWVLRRPELDQIARLRAENHAVRERAAQREQELKAQIEKLKRQNAQQARENPLLNGNRQTVQRERQTGSVQTSARSPAATGQERLALHVGDRLAFGSYPQTADKKPKPLIWRVLEIRNGNALILTEQLIDYKRFNDKLTDATWEDCSLRKWLNEDFMIKAFGTNCPARVVPVTNRNGSARPTDFERFHPTRDQVFLLSVEEVRRFFDSEKIMAANTTDYAHSLKYDYADRTDDWWLRSSGVDKRHAACVSHSGGIKTAGCDVNYYNVAIRPAMWLKL